MVRFQKCFICVTLRHLNSYPCIQGQTTREQIVGCARRHRSTLKQMTEPTVKDNDKVIARAPSSVCALHAAEYNLCACTENWDRKSSPRQRSCEPQASKRDCTRPARRCVCVSCDAVRFCDASIYRGDPIVFFYFIRPLSVYTANAFIHPYTPVRTRVHTPDYIGDMCA